MICTHQFIRINDAEKPRHLQGISTTSSTPVAPPVSWNGMIAGASAGCVKCGQVRKVFEDGTVEVVQQGGIPIDEDHGDSSGS